MASTKQIQANRSNAKRGGVKTTAGKAVSKYNAQKHAILRQTITEYEGDFYKSLIFELESNFNPVGKMEELLVERVAVHYIKLFRIQKVETEYMKSMLKPHKTHFEGGFNLAPIGDPEVEVVDIEGYVPRLDSVIAETLSKTFGRYETTIENKLYKAVHELERMQRLRKGDIVAPPLAIDLSVGSFGEKEDRKLS
jgi:hypothetical protein